ncbi:MAG: BamA/TamA family outer membrane protein [Gammaproteobacteria bacterium]|uniref:autotransporter assembly complex protein TamA n=1 Tax=Rhodoferax sp. TaxID=50421 RepID=UPI0018195D28|nr:BamA/TamA family outer membrane protein [Rhodoferax sp.]MBU3899342.1 BamA/TamA family outer membrane protein [Gammaproteobacteria bacterium]MBA3058943.1 BamA/TamA family outer membrane protein [Rhodoferax sp.]MBU3997438.1 BamA/TamA family outer membrane protein [Gammaproteobacteria bacterium]MBU4079114.1 BamA/TamA family outer membrane protein [Gammaproteobacteria bacterium]MBU4111867.1 BamA/TamA family outer membrane protein [Gammaproteobacteria bacterium]
MKRALARLLVGVMLGGVPALLQAQESTSSPPAAAPTADMPPAPVQPAFELTIEAPDEIRALLGRHLELLRYRELTDLSDSELTRLLLDADQNARELVATLGYFSPEIEFRQKAAGSDTATRLLTLSVVPGEPTVVGEVDVAFGGPIASDPAAERQRQQIQDNWSLRPGMRFTQARWASAKQQALRQLTTQSYPTGQLGTTLADIDPVARSAGLKVTLNSGPAYQLGGLVISGLQRYDAELVTRLARLPANASYDQAQLVAAQQRLADSGYFDSAFLSLDTSGDPSSAPVLVQLREARLQKLVLGIGASTDGGARLSVEHTHHKIPGIGWRAVSKLMLDRETRSIGTELTSRPDAKNWRWVTAAQLQNQNLGSFDINSQSLRAGRSQMGERMDRNYYLQYDRADTASIEATAAATASALSANYAFTVRNFDSLPFPNSGWGWGAEVGGGSTLGAEHDLYGRVLTRALGYWPLGRSDDGATGTMRAGRLALRAQAGVVLAKEGVNLPSTQLFLTGGDNTVRGYGYRDIGVTLQGGQITPGRYLAVGSVEWQRPMARDGRFSEWESTVFIDAGSVADKPAELRAKVGVGVGARWKSPVGPLQIDLAYGVAVKRLRLHLNVGFSF